jgi:mRNA-degrading endonuclease RelE of RelBE toxin-antitoxin system
MVDKIAKELKKYSPQEKNWVNFILRKIKQGDFTNLEVRKLKGKDDIYRIRKGDIRIIYKINSGKIWLIAIERRSDNTYNL